MAELKARIEAEIKNGGKIVLTKNNYGRQDIIDILVFSGYTVKVFLDGLTKAGIIEDDSFSNIKLVLEAEFGCDKAQTIITIEECEK